MDKEIQKIAPESMVKLLQYLQEKGLIKAAYGGSTSGNPNVSRGIYRVKHDDLAVVAGSQERGLSTFAHEIVHGLKTDPSRLDKVASLLKEIPIWHRPFVPEMVVPSRWEEGKMQEFPRKAFEYTPFQEYAGKSMERRYKETKQSIPAGVVRSGIAPQGEEDWQGWSTAREEGSAYYWTDPELARPMQGRAKEYGLFLRNRGVPMKLVAPVVEDLGKVRVPEWTTTQERFSGSKLTDMDIYRLILKGRQVK